MRRHRAWGWAVAFLFFVAATAGMAWPLVRHAGTLAPPHQDVYFNMWRLRWIAHALATSPRHLFDGNIFYPEKDTLAYSDALLVEGVLAAPLSGLNPVLVHTVMMLTPIAFSGLTMFALTRDRTGSRGAGLIAGTAFAFAPYRFDHLMHLELQWTVWMPLAFLALHRLIDSGRARHGIAAGVWVALQMLSCIYYGIFLSGLLAAGGVLLLLANRGSMSRRALPPLAAGAAIAVTVSVLYGIPYRRVHALVGDRPIEEVHAFSAQPTNYLVTPAGNWLYGNPGRPGRGERRLFPGSIVTLLAIAGLLLRRPSSSQIVYLLLLVAAFDVSLGFSGMSYPVLYRMFAPLRSLRALGRAGIFVVMFLAVLAAYGYAAAMHGRRFGVRASACGLLLAAMLAEYATAIPLVPYPDAAPPVSTALAKLPRGVVAELPFGTWTGRDLEGRYEYLSTFHWFPIVNGYSGNLPPSYLGRAERLQRFPGQRAVRQLRDDGVRYLVVHEAEYSGSEVAAIRAALTASGIVELGRYPDLQGSATLYESR
jgi:hypothetical protein